MRYARSRIYDLGEAPRETAAERESRRFEAAKEAWRDHRLLMIRPDDVTDEWARQWLMNYGNRLYGPPRRAEAAPGAKSGPMRTETAETQTPHPEARSRAVRVR